MSSHCLKHKGASRHPCLPRLWLPESLHETMKGVTFSLDSLSHTWDLSHMSTLSLCIVIQSTRINYHSFNYTWTFSPSQQINTLMAPSTFRVWHQPLWRGHCTDYYPRPPVMDWKQRTACISCRLLDHLVAFENWSPPIKHFQWTGKLYWPCQYLTSQCPNGLRSFGGPMKLYSPVVTLPISDLITPTGRIKY